MATKEQPVVNNYNIDAQSLVAWIAQNERNTIINGLIQSGVFRTEDGINLEALVYENWANRKEENHEPDIKIVNLTNGPVEAEESSESTDE